MACANCNGRCPTCQHMEEEDWRLLFILDMMAYEPPPSEATMQCIYKGPLDPTPLRNGETASFTTVVIIGLMPPNDDVPVYKLLKNREPTPGEPLPEYRLLVDPEAMVPEDLLHSMMGTSATLDQQQGQLSPTPYLHPFGGWVCSRCFTDWDSVAQRCPYCGPQTSTPPRATLPPFTVCQPEPPKSKICACGIDRRDCDYHR